MQQLGERVGRLHGVTPSVTCRQCAQRTEALVCLLQDILSDGDIDQRRMDIAVSEIGRQEWKLVLRIDAGAIPFQNAVHDHRVTQVVDARTGLALRRFDPGTPQYIDEPICDAMRSVACVSLIVPEQAGIGLCGAFAWRLASRYSRNADNALSVKGRILHFEELRSRIVIVPACRTTSPRSRRASSPECNPAQ